MPNSSRARSRRGARWTWASRRSSLFPPVRFAAEGDTIRARTHVPAQKLDAIMAYVEQKAKERFGGR